MKVMFFTVAVYIALMSIPVAAAPQGYGDAKITVTCNNNPVSNVWVWLNSIEEFDDHFVSASVGVLTDEYGESVFIQIAPGEWELWVASQYIQNITVVENDAVEINVEYCHRMLLPIISR